MSVSRAGRIRGGGGEAPALNPGKLEPANGGRLIHTKPPVTAEYEGPLTFTGTIHGVTIDVRRQAHLRTPKPNCAHGWAGGKAVLTAASSAPVRETKRCGTAAIPSGGPWAANFVRGRLQGQAGEVGQLGRDLLIEPAGRV
jgi:hypothetical protein